MAAHSSDIHNLEVRHQEEMRRVLADFQSSMLSRSPSEKTGSLKVKTPDPFDGTGTDSKQKLRNFISQCELYFKLKPEQFSKDSTAKVYFAASYLRGRRIRVGRKRMSPPSQEISTKMPRTGSVPGRDSKKSSSVLSATQISTPPMPEKLTALRQVSSVPVYTAEFRRLSASLKWNDAALFHHLLPRSPRHNQRRSRDGRPP